METRQGEAQMELPFFEMYCPAGEPCAITLVVHGLNLRPSRMGAIVNLLLGKGHLVINMALSGHRGNYGDLEYVTRQQWLNDYRRIWRVISDLRTHFDSLPCYFVGKSLGALSFLDAYTSRLGMEVKRAIFLAPAFELSWASKLITPMAKLNSTLPIPSASRRVDRLYSRLPVQAYHSLYQAYQAVQSKLRDKPLNLSCKIYVHSKDELVSLPKIRELLAKGWLPEAKLIEVDPFYGEAEGYHHLLVDEETMGPALWIRFSNDLLEFLNNPS